MASKRPGVRAPYSPPRLCTRIGIWTPLKPGGCGFESHQGYCVDTPSIMLGMRLGLDLDGCVYDFTEVFFDYCDRSGAWERLGLERPTERTWKSWDGFLQFGMTPEQFVEVCNEGVDSGYIFRVGRPIDGAVEVITKLREEGHTIHIITHRTFGKKAVHNTCDWLDEVGIEFDTITFAEDKTIVGVDLLLDDRDKNFYDSWDQGIPCVLFSDEHNRHVDTLYRVSSWWEFYEYVNDLAL